MTLRAPNIDNETAQECIQDIVIPPQPQALLDIRQAYPDIDKVAVLVARDPALGAAVLKTVNSPLFGIPKKIVKIEQAVMLLGLDSLMNIVNAVLLRSSLSQTIDESVIREFWQSAHDVAITISHIARSLKLCSPDRAFLLGLFHNCAMPLILEKHSNYMDSVASAYKQQRCITDVEDERYNANHATIGSYIARAWFLPDDIIGAIEEHHNPARFTVSTTGAEFDNVDILCALLKFAEHVVEEYKVLGRADTDHEWQRFCSGALLRLGIDEVTATNLAAEAIEVVQESDLNY